MIRFFDKHAFMISLDLFDRGKLLNFFLKEGRDNIILMYDQSRYYGVVTYYSLLNRIGGNGINIEKIIYKGGGRMCLARP